jgi:hypothetical protein
MAETQEKYRRLPGRGRIMKLFDPHRYQLWLGTDHLLYLARKQYSENYKRFYLKDIQALAISRTTRGRTENIIAGILAGVSGLTGLVIFFATGRTGPMMPFLIFSLILIIWIGINALFGPTCVSRIYTDVQVEDLPTLRRLRSARKTAAILKSAIDAAQGTLSAEELEASSGDRTMLRASAHAVVKVSAPPKEPEILKREGGLFHAVMFGLVLVLAASLLIDTFYQHAAKNILDLLLFLAVLILTTLSLVRQSGSDLAPGLKTTTWITLGILIGSYVFGTAFASMYRITHPELLAEGSPFNIKLEGPLFVGYCAIASAIFATVGMVGLLQLRRFLTARSASEGAALQDDLKERGQADDR